MLMVLIVVQITLYIRMMYLPQKFGMYEGTADSNGPVLETGFRPALVVLKKTTEDGDPWIVYDAALIHLTLPPVDCNGIIIVIKVYQ